MAFLGQKPCGTVARSPKNCSGRVFLFALSLICLALGASAFAQPLEAPEPRVKAAFLYNFTMLVSWPTNAFANSNAPIVIGVLGKDTLGEELDRIEGRRVAGRTIHVTRHESVDSTTNCHVVFVTDSERHKLDSIMSVLRNKPILTVGEARGFATQGVIELIKSDNNINLRINLDAASRAGLLLSSRLTRLDKSLRPPDTTPTHSVPKETR